MKNIALYTGFVAASLTNAIIFITTTTYLQLAVAIFIYVPLVYLAFKLFPRKTRINNSTVHTVQIPDPVEYTTPKPKPIEHTISEQDKSEGVDIVDINKRAFLKLIGAAGLTLFISSLFSKKAESLILGKAEEPGATTLQDATGNIINPAEHYPTNDYTISEVDYGISTFYGFIDRDEGWFIMKEDGNAGAYRYIKGNAGFRNNWKNRENLKYDYFNRIFPKT